MTLYTDLGALDPVPILIQVWNLRTTLYELVSTVTTYRRETEACGLKHPPRAHTARSGRAGRTLAHTLSLTVCAPAVPSHSFPAQEALTFPTGTVSSCRGRLPASQV